MGDVYVVQTDGLTERIIQFAVRMRIGNRLGVGHALLVRQEKLAESSGWKSRRGRS